MRPRHVLSLVVVLASLAGLSTAVAKPADPLRAAQVAAYHPLRLAARPAKPPHNVAVAYRGPRLQLEADSIGPGTLGFEPMVAVDRRGNAFYNARVEYADIPNPYDGHAKVQEQSLFRRRINTGGWSDISGGPSQHWSSQDPYLYADPSTGRLFWLDMVTGGATMSTSDDAGSTFVTTHIQALGMNDHPTMTTAAPVSGEAPSDPAFPRVVYYCTNGVAATECARSTDGGHVFTPIASPLTAMNASGVCNGSLTGHMAADREGRIFIGAADCGTPWVSVSSDGGSTWSDVVVTDHINTPANLNGSHDVNVAADAAGNVYAAWLDNRDSLPYLAISRDHGRHWQPPMMVAPPGVTAVEYPSIDAGDDGRVALSFIATSGKSSDNTRPWSYYVAMSTDATHATPLFVSSTVLIPQSRSSIVGRGFDCCSPMKDFLSVVVAPTYGGRVWGSLSDACTGACVSDPNGASDNANLGAAYVVREVSGPALRGSALQLRRGEL